jgi:Protein of unknown function (DUF3592)
MQTPANDSTPVVQAEDMRRYRVRRRRNWRWGAAVLSGGLLLLAAFVFLANYYSDASDSLRSSGIHTTGTVTRLGPDTGRTSGYAMVSYRAGSATLIEHVDLGSDVDGYHVGQQVAVYYDPSRATRMTIDSEDNQPGWTVMPMILMLVFGVGAAGVGGYTLFVRGRVTHLARKARWTPVSGTLWQPARGRQVVVLATAEPNPTVLRTALGSSISVRAGLNTPYDFSDTPRHHTVLLRPTDGAIAIMRRPRSDKQRDQWLRALPSFADRARPA